MKGEPKTNLSELQRQARLLERKLERVRAAGVLTEAAPSNMIALRRAAVSHPLTPIVWTDALR